MYPALLPLTLCTLALLAPAHAQVQRCTDARTGQVTYTDGACASGQRATEVLPALSPEERAAQERQYREAQDRLQAELARSQAAREAQAQAKAAEAAAQAARQPPPPVVVTVPEAQPYAVPYPVYVERPHRPGHQGKPPPPPPPQPGPGWHCNVFRCSDGKGNVVPRP